MAKKNAAQATRPPRDELKNLQASNQKLAAQYERQVNRALRESLTDFLDSYVDPRGALLDDNGELWQPIGAGRQGVSSGRWTWGFGGEDELFEAQAECRQLAFANEFAINGHENRISYIAGFGHAYNVAAKGESEASEALLAEVKAWLDELLRENRWQEKQQETIRRRDRDGECFIRRFHDREGMTRWRFVEPEQVRRPLEIEATEQNTFGIVTDAADAETREGYYVDGEWIAASEIQHRRANADSNRKRGVPLFYPVRKNLRRAEKLLRNMGTVAGIQAAVAWFEKITGAAQSTVQSYVASGADASVTNQTTGKTSYFTQYPPGSIIRKAGNTELEFPSSQVNPANFVPVLQAELRAVAARLCMPEWMLTSSADMANYASTMVSEGPAVRMFERLQGQQIADDLELFQAALAHAVSVGRLPIEALEQIEIQAEPPNLAVRDVLKEVQADLLLVGQRIMSPQTAASRNSLDYEQEQANIEHHDAAHPPAVDPLAMPGAGLSGDDLPRDGVSEAVLAYLRESSCGAGEDGAPGFQPRNTCAASGDGDTEADEDDEDRKRLSENAKKWRRKSSADEKHYLTQYTHASSAINAALRKCPETLNCLNDRQRVFFNAVNSAIDKAGELSHPVTLYRGISFGAEHDQKEFIAKINAAWKSGDHVSFNGFVSTTLDPHVAEEFAADDGPIFEIKAKTGLLLEAGVSSSPDELEVLQKHGTRYRVEDVVEKVIGESNYLCYRLEEI